MSLCHYSLLGPQVCPYFLSRDLAGTADVIFMPYNYLVDSSSRSQLSTINWTNAVIIVDEAHNIQVGTGGLLVMVLLLLLLHGAGHLNTPQGVEEAHEVSVS
jgi:hypothetical protein